ncbi:MAG: carboxylating nicotinate-nucleotide diphosphorylase [Pyrinomonadaceae bacterium]
MNWLDEGALYSQIGLFLREDVGRGDITTQAIVERNTRARGRFIAGEEMVVAGLEAAEEVFLTLDSQQQLEAFVSDGEQVEKGKVIARTSGFADVLLTGQTVALNLLKRLSAVASLTSRFVAAVEGTNAKIVDTIGTTPGLRMLERYAVALGGGLNSRFGLDDGVVITANHMSIVGGVSDAVKKAKQSLGYLHRVEVEVRNEEELKVAAESGADTVSLSDMPATDVARLISIARQYSGELTFAYNGDVTLESVRAYAEAGLDYIKVSSLTNSPPSVNIEFHIQP